MRAKPVVSALILSGLILPPEAAATNARQLGVSVDAGLPDGVQGALVWRPLASLRLHAGGGYNLVSPGIRAGIGYAPFTNWVTPALAVEVGRYFPGNANGAISSVTGSESDEPVLREFGYDYVSAHAGLEFGSERVTFFVHGGWSGIQAEVRNLEESLNSGEEDDGVTWNVGADPTVRLLVPSARTGFIVFF